MKRLSREYPYFISEKQKEKFWQDLTTLLGSYKDEKLAHDLRHGASLSYCIDCMKDMGWCGLSNVTKFHKACQLVGFEVEPLWDKNGNDVAGRFCVRPYKKNIKGMGF
jgi:hypothetical protein